MPVAQYNKDTRAKAKRAGLEVPEMALADLLIMGWEKMDAYIVAGLFNPLLSLKANLQELERLKVKPAFVKYYDERLMEETNTNNQLKTKTDILQDGEINFRSKDAIIDQLGSIVSTMKGKEKAEVLMKIADLQQMKKDEVKEEDLISATPHPFCNQS